MAVPNLFFYLGNKQTSRSDLNSQSDDIYLR